MSKQVYEIVLETIFYKFESCQRYQWGHSDIGSTSALHAERLGSTPNDSTSSIHKKIGEIPIAALIRRLTVTSKSDTMYALIYIIFS